MKEINDVVIIGGGPAGAYCALKLAEEGIYPIIFDHSHPREKACGGGISPGVIKKFPFLEKFRSMGYTFNSFKLIACIDDIQVTLNGLKNGFWISRKILDLEILRMAIEKGAKLIQQKVEEIHKENNYWTIKTEKRLFYTNLVIGADGVNSIVRKQTIGSISKKDLALTFGYITNTIPKEKAAIKILGEIPGYIWVFPGIKYSKIGIGSELQYGKKLPSILDAFIDNYCPNLNIISKYAAMVPSAKNPNVFQNTKCAGNKWILVGDAAGHVDPISGGGILYALWGAKLAAKAIKENYLESYDMEWKKEFGNDFKDRCEKKTEFYHPEKSTIAILLASQNSNKVEHIPY